MTLPSIPSIGTPQGPSRATSPAGGSSTNRSGLQGAASPDSFNRQQPTEADIQATLALANAMGGQMDDFLFKLGEQDRIEQLLGPDQAQLGMLHLRPGSIESLRPKVPANLPISNPQPLIDAWTARQEELNKRSLFDKLFRKPAPQLVDQFSSDYIERLRTLQQLKQSGVTSLDDFFIAQTSNTKARQLAENKAMSQQQHIKDDMELRNELKTTGATDPEIDEFYNKNLGIKDNPELRAELEKMGLNEDEIKALYQKTGVS